MHAVRRLVRSFLAAARGGPEPRHAAAAVVLGCAAGAVCGWNFTFAALVVAACLVNAPLPLLLTAAVCGQIAALAAAPLAESVGTLLLDHCGLGELLANCGSGPIGALFALDDYRLLGSLTIALAASSLPAVVAAKRATGPKSAAGRHAPLLRPWGRSAAALCAACVALLTHTVGSQRAGEALLDRLSPAMHVRATADRLDYNIWTGKLAVTNLRLADLDRPEHTVLVVEKLRAEVDPGLFLRGRLSTDELSLHGLFCDSTAVRSASRVAIFEQRPTLLKEDLPPVVSGDDPAREIELQSSMRDWPGLKTRLAVVERLITLVEQVGEIESPALGSAAMLSTIADRCPPRDFVTGRPAAIVQVKRVKIDGLPAEWRIGGDTCVELTDLTSRPATAPRPVQLVCDDTQRAVRLTITMHPASPDRCHDVALSVGETTLDSLLTLSATHKLLAGVQNSGVTLVGGGRATRERFEVDLAVQVSDVTLTATSERLAGLRTELWRQSLNRLGGLQCDAQLVGTWSQPKLIVRPGAVTRQLAGRLQAAGATDLARDVLLDLRVGGNTPSVGPTTLVAANYPPTNTPAAPNLDLAKAATATDNVAPLQPATIHPSPSAAAPEVAASKSAPSAPVAPRVEPLKEVSAASEAPKLTPAPAAPPALSAQQPQPRQTPPQTAPLEKTLPAAPVARSTATAVEPSVARPAARKPEPLPTSPLEAAAGLRQPQSVVNPHAVPGSINLTTGYSPREALDEQLPQSLPREVPQSDLTAPRRQADVSPSPTPRPRATFFGRSLLDPTDEPELATREEPAPPAQAEAAPAKKSLFDNFKGFAGRLTGGEEEQPLDESEIEIEPAPTEIEPAPKRKGIFPKLRSLIAPEEAGETATRTELDPFPDRVAAAQQIDRNQARRAEVAGGAVIEDRVADAVPQPGYGARQALYSTPQRRVRIGTPLAEAPGTHRTDTSPATTTAAPRHASAVESFYRRMVR